MDYFDTRLNEIAGDRAPEIRKRIQQRASMKRQRERVAERGYIPETWAQQTIWDARRRAKRGGLPITIDSVWVRTRMEAIGHKCELTGIPFGDENHNGAHKRPFMPSLDRIDARRGYTPENVRIVCVAINTLLQDWGDAVFIRITSAIGARSEAKG